MEHLFLMFLDDIQRRTTVGRTPLDEWSARRRDLYLTTHDTHNRQISKPPVGFEACGRSPAEIAGVLPTVVRRCVWSRNIKNRCSIYIYIYVISSLSVNDLNINCVHIPISCTHRPIRYVSFSPINPSIICTFAIYFAEKIHKHPWKFSWEF